MDAVSGKRPINVRSNFAAWQFLLKQAMQQLGWQAGTGLLLLLLALSVTVFYLQPLRQQVAGLQLQLSQLNRHHPQQQVNLAQNPDDIASQLYAVLPPENELNLQIAYLLAAADRAGLAVEKADYRRQAIADSSMVELHIQLPVSGSYVQMRQFISEAFNALPGLALSNITFNRDDIGSDFVKSDMQFNLYLRQNEPERQLKP